MKLLGVTVFGVSTVKWHSRHHTTRRESAGLGSQWYIICSCGKAWLVR